MRIRYSSVPGWRTTFVDTLALSFVFLILLVRPPMPDAAPLASSLVAEPPPRRAAVGMLASSLRDAVNAGRLSGGGVVSHGHRVDVTLPLRWLDEGQVMRRARTVAALAAAHGPATLEVVQLLPNRPNVEIYRSLMAMAREIPASWLVQVSPGPPRLRITVEPIDG